MSVPNLDKMSYRELTKFSCDHYRGSGYEELFPENKRGRKKCTELLVQYAKHLIKIDDAKYLYRDKKDVLEAVVHEYSVINQNILKELPDWAKWNDQTT